MLHNRSPIDVVDNTDVPQLFCTVTSGNEGAVFGAAVPLPAALLQPLFETVTVYTPAVLTVIDDAISPVLQRRLPTAVVDSVEVPLQLFTTVTTGVKIVALGDAVPLPAKLVQPSTVAVTV